MSTYAEFEQLLNEKASLESESRELEDEQNQLKAHLRALYEKIIQELRNSNNAKREAVNQLQAKIDEAQTQLDKLSMPNILEKAGVVTSENTENHETVEKTNEASDDNTSVVAGLEEQTSQTYGEQDPKKHRFF